MTLVRRLKQRGNRNAMESFAGGGAQRFGELQIVMGKVWRDMPQIACEPRQRGLRLGTPAVALAQCFHGKAMAEIVNPGSSAMMTEDAGALTSADPIGSQCGGADRSTLVTLAAIPQQWRGTIHRETLAAALPEIPAKFFAHG